MNNPIESDAWCWITDYIEVNHEYYNYKFPPCPYAKTARLNGMVKVSAYEYGSLIEFVKSQVDDTHDVKVMFFPSYIKWFFPFKIFLKSYNKFLVKKDFYIQFGTAVGTHSKYPGVFYGQPYYVVIINKLSDVLNAHNSLSKTDYYKKWDKKHFTDVVTRRQKMFEKYSAGS